MVDQVASDAGFVKASDHRVAVLRRLAQSPAIPKEVKQETGRPYSRVSEALKSLSDRDLVVLLVPEGQKKGRLYALTERGENAWEYMVENDIVGKS